MDSKLILPKDHTVAAEFKIQWT